ncbi:hypothetical protein P22_1569 [Propionispora sp. 2/2-37]|uniref:YwmB family TATA-box binding protein n=1 Tax=Propionispora sp. 2/2-37 TaxID=1677858 RepID=UPI0006BB7FC5|nr:YwmB family TATA-box binding protein [Propionispora sp. 2/2-37]CUH95498.1 hypothetical protein P22_1569 [Propionispora sp. 2/2-37]
MRWFSYGIIGFGILGVCLLCLSYVQAAATTEVLRQAMAALELKEKEASVSSWTELPWGKISEEECSSIVAETMKKLEIGPEQYRIGAVHNGRQRFMTAEAVLENVTIRVLVESVTFPDKGRDKEVSQHYLVVHVTEYGLNKSILDKYRQKVSDIIANFGETPRITTCLVGYLDGKLGKEEWAERINKAFQAVHATQCRIIYGENFASGIGYTAGIPESVDSNHQPVNVNVAVRYSEFENRTYFIIGSPVINREY